MDKDKYHLVFKDKIQYNYYKKLLKSLKTYNMLAYKEYFFKLLPSIKEGNFLGKELKEDTYLYKLPSSLIFRSIYGNSFILYTVDNKSNIFTIQNILPSNFYYKGSLSMLEIYKGVPLLDNSYRNKVDLFIKLNSRKED